MSNPWRKAAVRRLSLLLTALALAVLCQTARAEEVRVFKPMEEGMTAMSLRSQAQAEGFAQAVLDAAQVMLPAPLNEVRTEYFREYLNGRAEPYIQGYRVLSTEASDAGVILRLDVTVNKPALREGLRRLGLMASATQPVPAALVVPDDLDEENRTAVQHLVVLTGVQVEPSALPRVTIERAKEKGVFRGRLETADREWMAVGKDIATLWFDMWGHYFGRESAAAVKGGGQVLDVTGWFSPDAALEFDRVLRNWDSSVQDVELVELDMQPSGVGATWSFRVLDGARLDGLLRGFLPQRGLSYRLADKGVR